MKELLKSALDQGRALNQKLVVKAEASLEHGLLKRVLDRGLSFNEQTLSFLNNGFDWLFMRESMVHSGLTSYEVIYQGDLMSVRYYPLPEEDRIPLPDGQTMPVQRNRHPIPLLLVPPLGVTTETFDLMPQRSLVKYMAARGFHTYMIDWGKPEKRHAPLGMKDYAGEMFATALTEVRRHAGVQEVSLMGWCMGGLLCLMHLGLTKDPHVKNLITVASPIDMRGGGVIARTAGALNTPAKLIRKFSSFRLHNLDPSKIQLPAWTTTLAFKLTDPLGSITTYWDLVTRLADRKFVESYSTTADYLNNMLMYPAGVVQDMVIKVAVDNKLALGRIEIGGQVAELDRINANFLAYAGETDILVPESIARRIVEIVASKDKEFRMATGGHMGVILGSKAQKEVWEPCAQWLAQRSKLDARKTSFSGADETQRKVSRRRQSEDPTL